MHRFRPKRPSPALVVAVVALAAALTGTAVAEIATTARLDRVEKKQVRKLAKKIAAKISKRQANRQITRRAPNLSVASAKNAETASTASSAASAASATSATTAETASSVAANGVNAQAIASGAVTAEKLADATIRFGTATSVPAGETRLVAASCDAGEKLLSGGGVWSGVSNATDVTQLHVVHAFPSGSSWETRVYNGGAAARNFTPRAVCLTN